MPATVPGLQIGSHQIWPPLVLAPMSGVTNRTMRALYKPFGLGLTVTEFVSSNALKYGSKRTMEMIDQHGLEKPVSTQLWGDDPTTMAAAAKVVRECGADIVDINFGCPAPKVTKTNGGSACLRDDRCEAIMKAVVDAVDCPVTMKMRLGWSETDLVYVDVAKRAQAVGVQAVTLHARTARQFYKGNADWEHIARLKEAIDIPVIGNGDLDDPYLAIERMRASGVDAADGAHAGRSRKEQDCVKSGGTGCIHRADIGEIRARRKSLLLDGSVVGRRDHRPSRYPERPRHRPACRAIPACSRHDVRDFPHVKRRTGRSLRLIV